MNAEPFFISRSFARKQEELFTPIETKSFGQI